MKKISLFVVIFIWLLCTANDCKRERDDCHTGIDFVNNSPRDVYIDCCFCYDTLEYSVPSLRAFDANSLRVKPNEKNTTGLWAWGCLESSERFIQVYVYDTEVVETVPRDTIEKYRMVLKIYRPTIDELQSSDWTITYTGE
jgi:hypothetical protein